MGRISGDVTSVVRFRIREKKEGDLGGFLVRKARKSRRESEKWEGEARRGRCHKGIKTLDPKRKNFKKREPG